jgi:hypothetical protein
MSYLQVHFWPGGTEEQYLAMIKALHPETGLPEGQPYQRPDRRWLPDIGSLGLEGAERGLHAEHTPAGTAGGRWIRRGSGGTRRTGGPPRGSLTLPRTATTGGRAGPATRATDACRWSWRVTARIDATRPSTLIR